MSLTMSSSEQNSAAGTGSTKCKPGKTDVAPNRRKTYRCIYCGRIFKGGGINRLKHHLAKVTGSIGACLEVPADVKQDMRKALGVIAENKKQAQGRRHMDDDPFNSSSQFEGDMEIEDDAEVEEVPRPRNQGVAINEHGGNGQRSVSKKAPNGKGIGKYFPSTTTLVTQPSIHCAMAGKEAVWGAHMACARFFYDTCITMNAVNSINFQPMFDAAITKKGRGVHFLISTCNWKELYTFFLNCSSDHFPRDHLGAFILRRMLRRGISMFPVGPLYGSAYQHGALSLLRRLFANSHCNPWMVPMNAVMNFAKPSAFPCALPFWRTGLHHLVCRKDYLHQLPHDTNTTEGKWSLLPVLILWMVKDKLDFIDDVHLAAVCRDWWSASACYPKKQSIGDGMPWIMQLSTDLKNGAREFISITRKRKFTMDLPEFGDAMVLFSKQGWILMRRRNFSKSAKRMPDSLFLINPFTKANIKMPDIIDMLYGYHGSFSIHEGYPHCIVLLVNGDHRHVTVRTAYPGDEVWTEHSYIGQRMRIYGFSGVATIGEHIYCFSLRGMMMIYNMDSQVWKELPGSEIRIVPPGSGNRIALSYMMECEGHIVKLDQNSSSYTLFRYNDTDTSWERLDNDDVKGTSFFLLMHKNGLPARINGSKVYVIRRKRDRFSTHFDIDALAHDLMDGSTQTVHLSYPLHLSATWVDLG